jgi:hypothetical protein
MLTDAAANSAVPPTGEGALKLEYDCKRAESNETFTIFVIFI